MPERQPLIELIPALELQAAPPALPSPAPPSGSPIGRSREGRPLLGYRFGDGPTRISLIGGCHADEPVGPLLLGRLVSTLAALDRRHPVLERCQWWIVPHADPDGAARNAPWQEEIFAGRTDVADLAAYLRHVDRAVPGEDLEFGFPRNGRDVDAAPETRAVTRWWATDRSAWAFHASLHGMAFASGPWFLLEPDAIIATADLRNQVRDRVRALGYSPRDVDRGGEKGFHRIDEGFSTRPRSDAMQQFFEERGDPRTAALFRPNSMETIRRFNDDSRYAITAVTECPLFLRNESGTVAAPAARETTDARKATEAAARLIADGVRPMPIPDQIDLMWTFLAGGIDVAEERRRAEG